MNKHPSGRLVSIGRATRRRTLPLLAFGCAMIVLSYVLVHMGGSQGEVGPHVAQTTLAPAVFASVGGGAADSDAEIADAPQPAVPTATTAMGPGSDKAAMGVLRAYNNNGVDALLRCGDALHDGAVGRPASTVSSSNGSATTMDTAAASAFSKRQNKQRFDRCYRAPGTKFLYFGNNWGRHFNQVTSLVAAITLSALLHRTLIVPPFVFEGRRVHVYDLYDARRLFDIEAEGSPYCVLTEEEFYELEVLAHFGGEKPRGGRPIEVDAACVTMRGITKHPQLPVGFKFHCVAAPFVKFKKNLKLLFDVVGASEARLLTLPLVIYYAQALPEPVVLCPWRRLRPHPVLATAVSMLMARRALPSNDKTPKDVSARVTIGVHLRSLEGSCKSRQRQYANRTVAEGMEQQCSMLPEYILDVARRALRHHHVVDGGPVLNGAGELINEEVAVVIADDGQQPQRAQELARTLPNAIRVQDVLQISGMASPVKAYLDEARRAPRPLVSTAVTGGGRDDGSAALRVEPPYDLSNHFHLAPGALPLLLDFWALATTTVFVGNQVSTLSMNVCRYRRAMGMRCDNFV